MGGKKEVVWSSLVSTGLFYCCFPFASSSVHLWWARSEHASNWKI